MHIHTKEKCIEASIRQILVYDYLLLQANAKKLYEISMLKLRN